MTSLASRSPQSIVQRLLDDQPLFHSLDRDGARWLAEQGIAMAAGDFSLAVGPAVLHWIADRVTSAMRCIETGAGYTTVLLAAVAHSHLACTPAASEERRIRDYLSQIGVQQSKVEFLIGPSDEMLPRLDPSARFDFAFIDGAHGYPMPALDWHYIDRRLEVGGLLAMDNVELRPVREHCRFLEENGCYELVDELDDPTCDYVVCFYRKLRESSREWVLQPYCKIPPSAARPVTWRTP